MRIWALYTVGIGSFMSILSKRPQHLRSASYRAGSLKGRAAIVFFIKDTFNVLLSTYSPLNNPQSLIAKLITI